VVCRPGPRWQERFGRGASGATPPRCSCASGGRP
jgi:hypothetical protein